jgi:mycothiol system anti-sigma-R factor
MGDSCDEALDSLFAYIDKELPEPELTRIAEHLKSCPPCEAERRINERIKEMVSRCPQETAPDRLRDRILGIVAEARGAN